MTMERKAQAGLCYAKKACRLQAVHKHKTLKGESSKMRRVNRPAKALLPGMKRDGNT